MFHPYPCPHTFSTSESSLHSLKLKKNFFTVLYYCIVTIVTTLLHPAEFGKVVYVVWND